MTKKYSKLIGLILLKAKESIGGNIIVFCYKPTASCLDTALAMSDFGEVKRYPTSIDLGCGTHIFFLPLESSNEEVYRGYRATTIIIEGSRKECGELFFNQIVVPMLSMAFDPYLAHEIASCIGEPLPDEWFAKPRIFFENYNYKFKREFGCEFVNSEPENQNQQKKMKAKPIIYKASDSFGNEDWAVVSDSSDCIQICGLKDCYGENTYFESDAYHLEEFCRQNGFTYQRKEIEVEI